MKHWAPALLLALIAIHATAQSAAPSAQHLIEQVRQQQLQTEADLSRMSSEIELRRLERERQLAAMVQERQAEFLRKQAELREAAAAEVVQKAEEAADEVREEVQLAQVRSANAAYLLAALGLPTLLGIFIAKKASKEGSMKYEQMFGTVVMICSLLFMLAALVLSEGWATRYDAIHNIMSFLQIRLFPESDYAYAEAAIDFPTKYLLMALAVVFSYGFTTYLGITPAWRRAPKPILPNDVASEP